MSAIPDDSTDRHAEPFYPSLLPKHEHPERLDDEGIPILSITRYDVVGAPIVPGLLDRQDPILGIRWCVEQDTPTVPLAFDRWITLPDHLITVPEYNRLARIVGKKHVEFEDRASLEVVIKDLVSEIAFPELRSHWLKLAHHLDEIIQKGEAYLSVARPSLKLDDTVTIVPAPITVLVSLLSCPDTAQDMRASLVGVERTVKHCKLLRELMAPKIRRGEKGWSTVIDLLGVVVNIAGDKLELPSNQEMENSAKTSPVLTLARKSLDIACRVATTALEQASLPDDRRAKAIDWLEEIRAKKNRAIADQLRPLIKAKNALI